MQQFGQLRRENMSASDMRQKDLEAEACGVLPKASEIDLQLNPQLVGFTKRIGPIYSYINLFDLDITLDMNFKHSDLIGYRISEEFFRVIIENNFLSYSLKNLTYPFKKKTPS
jgi:hypothetical protein